jgi:hypothetical protein
MPGRSALWIRSYHSLHAYPVKGMPQVHVLPQFSRTLFIPSAAGIQVIFFPALKPWPQIKFTDFALRPARRPSRGLARRLFRPLSLPLKPLHSNILYGIF